MNFKMYKIGCCWVFVCVVILMMGIIMLVVWVDDGMIVMGIDMVLISLSIIKLVMVKI